MSDDNTTGGDDNVVVGPGGNKQQQGPKVQKAEDVLASIKGEFKAQKTKEFKTAATVILKEIDEANKVLKLAEAKLAKLVAEFQAENT